MNRAACLAAWCALTALTCRAQEAPPASSSVRVVFVGDIMPGSTWPRWDRPADPVRLWGSLPNLFRASDAAFGNLEGALTDGGAPVKSSRCTHCYSFRLPTSDAALLKAIGLTGVSLANNHAGDFGSAALVAAPGVLAEAGVAADGPAGRPPTVWRNNGRTWSLLAFAPNSGVRDLRDLDGARNLIGEARAGGALVVVSMHAGGEGAGRERVRPGTETYLGENRGDPVTFARAAIDAGAAVVYGHGPHLPRAIEVYRGHLILYSLGNAVSFGGLRRTGAGGLTPAVETHLDVQSGGFLWGRVHSFVQNGRDPVSEDPQQTAARWMAALSKTDRPEVPLCWGADGTFASSRPTGCPAGLALLP